MKDTLLKLCSLSGVSGDEGEVREYIKKRVEPYADEITTDAMGNLIVYKKGAKTIDKTILLAAHMDEVGVIVTHITDEGYLKFSCVGGMDRRVLLGKSVYIGRNRVYGIIGLKAIHLTTKEERKSVPKVDSMYIDIGAKSKEEAEKLVSLGDTGAFDPKCFCMGDDLIKAKAVDDRVGCAAMIKLIESDLPLSCTFVFTVQEEVGTRGVFGAAFKVKPDVALVLEGTTAADIAGVKGSKRICSVGGGVVIPYMDRAAIYDRNMYSAITKLADEKGIKWQTKTYIAGGTDGSAIQRSRGGVKVAGLACAVRNIHSPASVLSISDAENMLKLAKEFLQMAADRH